MGFTDFLNFAELILINKTVVPPEKDFKALINAENRSVVRISINEFGPNAFFCPPIYKLSNELISNWLKIINQYVLKNKTNLYAEDALNEVLGHYILNYSTYKSCICSEIDTYNDLITIKELYGNK